MAFKSIHVEAQIKSFLEKERGIFIGKLRLFQRIFVWKHLDGHSGIIRGLRETDSRKKQEVRKSRVRLSLLIACVYQG